MQDIIDHLINPERVFSRSEVMSRDSPVPRKPGVYAWFFREIPPGVPTSDCVIWKGLTLLYGGISPSEPSKKTGKVSSQNLYKRIRTHMNGNAYGSTFRQTLGCLLRVQLDIQPQITRNQRGITFGEGKIKLSSWISENAFVTWQVHETPWEVEKELIQSICLPLNLQGNESHPFYQNLKRIRKDCKGEAL